MSCGWRPQILHKLPPWNVWYLLMCAADPGSQDDAKLGVYHVVSQTILLFYPQKLLSVMALVDAGMEFTLPCGGGETSPML